ncbi:MAG: hypothetical protein MJE77_24175 [Proteobacteria bacterium]|nr:hypothetical protein [Pseudomonadota bacterium]
MIDHVVDHRDYLEMPEPLSHAQLLLLVLCEQDRRAVELSFMIRQTRSSVYWEQWSSLISQDRIRRCLTRLHERGLMIRTTGSPRQHVYWRTHESIARTIFQLMYPYMATQDDREGRLWQARWQHNIRLVEVQAVLTRLGYESEAL